MVFLEKANNHLATSGVLIAFVADDPQIRKNRICDCIFAAIASETEYKLLCQIKDLFHCDLPSPPGPNIVITDSASWPMKLLFGFCTKSERRASC
jgi:hypothetical protein